MEEIWKDIKNYEDKYQVSNLGRIRSKNRILVYKNGKPEVGDVWAFNNGLKFIILKETLSNAMPFGEDVKYPAYEVLEESLEQNFFDELPFINGTFKYLGKSKANINELFEVCDENI